MFNKHITNFFIILTLGMSLLGCSKEYYVVAYNLNDGIWKSKFTPQTSNRVNKKIKLPNGKEIQKNGYIFSGWYTTQTFESGTKIKNTINSNVTKKIDLYAKWNLIDYTITYNLNGGKNNTANPTKYNIETKSITLAEPKKTGYIFAGWYEKKDFSGKQVTAISKGNTKDINLYAKWNLIDYTITYNLNGGENNSTNPTKYNIETQATTLSKPKRIGAIFDGWYDNKDFTGNKVTEISKGNTKDINLYAKWNLIDYTITYNLDGGENNTANPTKYNIETQVTTLAIPKKTGYTFDGWYKDKNFKEENKLTKITKNHAENIELHAKWSKLSEEITQSGDIKVTLNYNTNVEISAINGFLYNIKTKTIEKTHKNKKIALKKDKAIYSEEEVPVGAYIIKIELYDTNNILFNTFADIIYVESKKKTQKEETLINSKEIYSVNYNTNGGTWNGDFIPTKTHNANTFVLLPDENEIERCGGVFKGWYSTKNFVDETKLTYIPFGFTKNIDVYAKWELIDYTINYNLNGGENSKSNPVKYNVETGVITLAEAKRVGYTFCGWYENKDFAGDKLSQILQGSTENIDLYAKWALVDYAINYNLNGGENDTANLKKYNVETQSRVLAVPKKIGYSFDGWYENKDFIGNKITEISKGSTKDINLYAKWELIDYTISYNLNGGENDTVNPKKYNVETQLAVLAEPKKTGYTFDGWYENKDFSGNKITEISKGSTEDVNLYAKWNLIDYTITYNLNGGENNNANPAKYNVETQETTLAEPKKIGYTFAGWYENTDFTGKQVTEISKGRTKDVNLYAKWNLIDYIITYNLDGGENNNANPVEYNVETQTTTLAEPKKVGYTFDGWYENKDFTGDKVSEIKQGTKNLDLYAKWRLVDYTINYNLNGGENSKSNPVKYNVETGGITLAEAKRVGYTFDGWYENKDFIGDKVSQIKYGTKNLDLYAKWNLVDYTINYNLNGGENDTANPKKYNVETQSRVLAVPKKVGYSFGGWYANKDFTGKQVTEISKGSTKDVNLYAKWNLIDYIITYNLDGGENNNANPVEYNVETQATTLAEPKKTGYIFDGWYESKDFTGNKVTEIPQGSIGDIKLYAKWELINYSITYNTNGGENASINPISYNIETEIIKLKNPRRSGYIFLGWYKTPDFTDNKVETISCGTSDLILYAKWCAINYKLIIIVLCIFILLISTFIILSKLSIKRKIKEFEREIKELASKVLEYGYNFDYLDGALEAYEKGKKDTDVKNEINKYTKEEICFYKQHKVHIRRCYKKMEKERDDKAQQKKKSENNKADIKEEVDDKIQDLKRQNSGIVKILEEKESLESLDFLVDEFCDKLDFILNNKSFVPKKSYTKIKDASELFEKNVYEKAKSMDGFSGTGLETKMKQVKAKFDEILK